MATTNRDVNTEGPISAISPFDTVVLAGTSYTIVDRTPISEAINKGIDVYTSIYTKNGLTVDEYAKDYATNVVIVTLRDRLDNVVYIPDNYITSIDGTCTMFSDYVIGIPLGTLPDGYDLSGLMTALKEDIKTYLGVDVTIDGSCLIKSSVSVPYDQITASAMINGLTPNSPASKSCRTKLLECGERVIELQGILKKIECKNN
jgi:hypothetical protein